MKQLKVWTVALVALVAACAASATEYFVDGARPDNSGDGKSEGAAFKTIQYALTKVADYDTVTVLPGDYAEDPVEVKDGDYDAYKSLSRLYITKKITLRSRDGAAKTHIIGRRSAKAKTDATYADGMGADAVRCISVDKTTASGTVIQGFTIRDGASNSQDASGNDVATGSQDSSRNRAGGVNTTKAIADGAAFYVVDCVVSNCVGTRGGGVYGGTCVRTLFAFNQARNYGAAGRQCNFYNCVFTRNAPTDGALAGGQTGAGITAYAYGYVNCTFVDNSGTTCMTMMSGNAYNTLFVNNGGSVCDADYRNRCYNCVTYDNNVTTSGTNCRGGNEYELVNPLVDDYRLAGNAKSVGAGDKQWLDMIPSGYADTDFCGQPRVTDGVVNVGAVQAAVPIYGVIKLPNTSQENGCLRVNGREIRATALYCCATRPRELLRVEVTPLNENYGVQRFEYPLGTCYWPELDDSGVFLYPQDGSVSEIRLHCKKVVWADASAPDDSGDGSAAQPLRTIQGAYEKMYALDGGVVYVREGDYNEGGRYNATYGVTNRLNFYNSGACRVKAVGDRAKTVIWGASDPTSADGTGCGPAAVRCVLASNGSSQFCVQGLTLRGGRVAYSEKYSDGDAYRGGCFRVAAAGYGSGFLDCAITDGCAGRGAAGFGGCLVRCVVTNNVVAGTGNAIVRGGTAIACLFADNDARTSFLIGQDQILANCTLVGNRMSTTGQYRYDVSNNGSRHFNCVFGVTENSLRTYESQANESAYGCLSNHGSDVPATSVKDDPCFVDAAHGDYRLLGCSAGVGLARTDWSNFVNGMLAARDLEGRPFGLDANGGFVAGCYAEAVPGYRGTASIAGGISPSTPAQVTEATDVTFTAAKDRPLLRFEVNGEDVGYELKDGKCVYTLRCDPQLASGWTVKAVYGTDWYVSPTGDDANNGYSRETPLKTLKKALSKTAEFDTVHAAPGVYDEGEFAQGDDGIKAPFVGSTRSRVFVSAGRTLVSDGGAAVTFIAGHDDPDHRTDNYGLGPNALRCAALAQNAKLKGFTLVDGHSNGVNSETFDNEGGGVRGYDKTSLVEDCVISNCVAYRGGGMRYASAVRCKFVGNRAVAMGSGPRDSWIYDCLVDRNFGLCAAYVKYALRCTFGPNNRNADDTGATGTLCFAAQGDDPNCLTDCLIADGGSVEIEHATNCVFQSLDQLNTAVNGSRWKDEKTDAAKAAARLVAGDGSPVVDANGRPVKGCPAIDKIPLTALEDGAAAVDADGGQRVWNNAADIGCYDYDWRNDYARQVARSGAFAVTSAAPTCVSTEAGVLILAGKVAAAWDRTADETRFSLKVQVTGAGTLTVLKDGAAWKTLTAADGEQSIEYAATNHTLDFDYAKAAGDTDAVGALIAGAKRLCGTRLFVR